jgi:hypothetical protein
LIGSFNINIPMPSLTIPELAVVSLDLDFGIRVEIGKEKDFDSEKFVLPYSEEGNYNIEELKGWLKVNLLKRVKEVVLISTSYNEALDALRRALEEVNTSGRKYSILIVPPGGEVEEKKRRTFTAINDFQSWNGIITINENQLMKKDLRELINSLTEIILRYPELIYKGKRFGVKFYVPCINSNLPSDAFTNYRIPLKILLDSCLGEFNEDRVLYFFTVFDIEYNRESLINSIREFYLNRFSNVKYYENEVSDLDYEAIFLGVMSND